MAGSNGKETDPMALTESYKPGWLDDADKRRREVSAVIAAREALIRDLGGDLSTQKHMTVDRIVFMHLRLTTLEGKWLNGEEIDWQHYTYTSNVDPIVFDPPINFHEFVMGLLSAGEIWIDNISVIDTPGGDGTELIQNGSFETDVPGGPGPGGRLFSGAGIR